MKLKNIISAAVALSVVLQCFYVTAEKNIVSNSIKVKMDYDTSEVRVFGTLGKEEDVFFEVINPKGNTDNFDEQSYEQQKALFNHIEQGKVSGNQFSFIYHLNGAKGEYLVRVKSNSLSKPLETSFYYVDTTETNAYRETLNGYIASKDTEQIISFITANLKLFFKDAVFFDSLSDTGKKETALGLISAGNLTAMKDIQNEVIRYSVIQAVYEAQSPKQAADIIFEYADYLNIAHLAEYETSKNQDDDYLTDIGARMKAERFAKAADFETAFKKSVMLTGIKKAANYSMIKPIITQGKKSLGFSFTAYFSLASTTQVDKKLVGNDYKSIVELENAIIDIISSLGNSPGGGSPGRNSSGGNTKSSGINMSVDAALVDAKAMKEEVPFSDVTEEYWGYESILCLAKLGYINGDGNGKFRPDDNVTRKEFLKIALAAFKIEDGSASCSFSDVSADDWCYLWIASAQKYGIISGVDGQRFDGDSYISREDAAKILHKIISLKSYAITELKKYEGFDDEGDISDYALESVKIFYKAGILNGVGNGMFMPKKGATRAETAKMIVSVLQNI